VRRREPVRRQRLDDNADLADMVGLNRVIDDGSPLADQLFAIVAHTSEGVGRRRRG
jgi:hypothetical protein